MTTTEEQSADRKLRERYYLITGKLSSSHSGEFDMFKAAIAHSEAAHAAEVQKLREDLRIARRDCMNNAGQLQEVQALLAMQSEAMKDIVDAYKSYRLSSSDDVERAIYNAGELLSATAETVAAWEAKKLEPLIQRIAKLEDDVINANTEQFVNLRAIAAEDACEIFKAEKEALEKKLAEGWKLLPAELTEALNQHKYLEAQVLATDIAINMSEVTLWIGRELKGEK